MDNMNRSENNVYSSAKTRPDINTLPLDELIGRIDRQLEEIAGPELGTDVDSQVWERASTRLLNQFIRFAMEKKAVDRISKDRERLKGVLEMAGAVCHEFNQPLQSLSGIATLLIMDTSKSDPFYPRFQNILEAVERMGGLTRKLMHITAYKTKPYALGESIIDIEKAADDA